MTSIASHNIIFSSAQWLANALNDVLFSVSAVLAQFQHVNRDESSYAHGGSYWMTGLSVLAATASVISP